MEVNKDPSTKFVANDKRILTFAYIQLWRPLISLSKVSISDMKR